VRNKRKARAIEGFLDDVTDSDIDDFERGVKAEKARKLAEELREEL
jgi:uncharacterized protein YbaA (DUF1428 family)